jgi:cyclopropane fatty-acyl-phospholipid synthase-like methyltransferase
VDYQPRWQDGRTVGPQERDCAGRYQAIVPFVAEGARVLDFGAFSGYFSHRLADERAARCVAVAPEVEPYPGVTVVKQRLTVDGLKALGHFDVVLALSVLHHLDPWEDYLSVLCSQGDTVIVEVPHPAERFNHCPADKVEAIAAAVYGPVLCRTPGYRTDLLRPTILAKGRLGLPGGS